MERVRAALLPEPDGDHLHQAALHLAGEVRMRLDAVDRDDHVGAFVGVAIDEDGHAGAHLADLHGLHAGADLAADQFGRHAVGSQDFELSLGRGASVAPHRRHGEDIRPGGAQPDDRLARHVRDPVDAPAADGKADARAGLDRRSHRLEGGAYGLGDVPNLGRIHTMPDDGPARQDAAHELGEVSARRSAGIGDRGLGGRWVGQGVGRDRCVGKLVALHSGGRLARIPAEIPASSTFAARALTTRLLYTDRGSVSL